MFALIITSLVVLGVSAAILFFTGWLTIGISTLFDLIYSYHQKFRRNQRPSRIFLIRHGESQTKVDPSKYSLKFSKKYILFL